MADQHLTGIIRKNSMKYGSRDALFYKGDYGGWASITWENFWQHIWDTAKALLSEGIKPGDRVAIISRNMPEWTITDYALQLLRAVSVPVFASTSGAQLSFMLNETGCKWVMAGEQEQYDIVLSACAQIPSLQKIIVFDKEVHLSDQCTSTYFTDFVELNKLKVSDDNIEELYQSAQNDDLCTIIYTSGTSGEPKGVMLTIGNFLHSIRIHDLRINIYDTDVSLCFLPLSHVFERGWTSIVLAKGIRNYYLRNPKEVVEAVKDVRPTLMCSVPRFFEKTYDAVNTQIAASSKLKQHIFKWAIKRGGHRLDYVWNGRRVPFFVRMSYKVADILVLKQGRAALGGNFRFMVCGGAALSLDVIHFFEQVGIHIKVGYGLTETLATVTCLLDDDINTSAVGKVMPLTDLKIGENDEIMVKGDSIFKGYYKRPDLTEAAFKDGYFCTGDAGRLDEQSYLYLKDRIKDIIKTSSGKYVAPQKIEALLGSDMYIEQITLIGNERKYITALVVPAEVAFGNLMKELLLENLPREEQVKITAVIEFYQQRINALQKDLSPFEQVKKITLLPNEFTIASGELTPSLKIKRKVVADKFMDEIEKMYE